MASLVEFISEENYGRYNEILGIVEEAYKNRPRQAVKRGPMTLDQKIKMAENRKAKAEAALAALMAAEENS